MRRLSKFLLPVLFAGWAASASAEPRAGLARADSDFQLTRHEVVQTYRSGLLTAVQIGDRLQAGKTALRVEGVQSGTFIAAPAAKVALEAPGLIRVEEGALVVASEPAKSLRVNASELLVAPAPTADKAAQRVVYLVRTPHERLVEVEVVSGALTVSHPEQETQLGYLAAGDGLRFEKTDSGWRAGAIGLGQDASTSEEGVTGDSDDTKRGAAALLRGSVTGPGGVTTATAGSAAGGAGVAVATAGTGFFVNNTISDNQKTEDDKKDESPVSEGQETF
ncbi:MAG: hypothetical protein KF858_17160 [Candidatus Sumerlaeia bacterium]|nr:hypothetical protein [Candidatus Sumerlaeia bacterium]